MTMTGAASHTITLTGPRQPHHCISNHHHWGPVYLAHLPTSCRQHAQSSHHHSHPPHIGGSAPYPPLPACTPPITHVPLNNGRGGPCTNRAPHGGTREPHTQAAPYVRHNGVHLGIKHHNRQQHVNRQHTRCDNSKQHSHPRPPGVPMGPWPPPRSPPPDRGTLTVRALIPQYHSRGWCSAAQPPLWCAECSCKCSCKQHTLTRGWWYYEQQGWWAWGCAHVTTGHAGGCGVGSTINTR